MDSKYGRPDGKPSLPSHFCQDLLHGVPHVVGLPHAGLATNDSVPIQVMHAAFNYEPRVAVANFSLNFVCMHVHALGPRESNLEY